jgi:hypothetical protein
MEVKDVLKLEVGTLVAYYLAGWRYGHYDGTAEKGRKVKIRPIPGYKAVRANNISVPVEDVKTI